MINALGEKHGTITARINDTVNFEVTTLRIDKVLKKYEMRIFINFLCPKWNRFFVNEGIPTYLLIFLCLKRDPNTSKATRKNLSFNLYIFNLL